LFNTIKKENLLTPRGPQGAPKGPPRGPKGPPRGPKGSVL